MVPTKQQALEVWEPHFDLIATIHKEAWSEWKDVNAYRVDQGYGSIIYPREISNYLFGAIARRAIWEFGKFSDVLVDTTAQTFRLYHRGQLLRFKKGNENKLGMNHPTQAVLDFVEADRQPAGLPPETAKLEVTWIGNELFTDMESLFLIARDGEALVWEHQIGLASGASLTDISGPRSGPDADNDDDIEGLVTPKPQRNKDASED